MLASYAVSGHASDPPSHLSPTETQRYIYHNTLIDETVTCPDCNRDKEHLFLSKFQTASFSESAPYRPRADHRGRPEESDTAQPDRRSRVTTSVVTTQVALYEQVYLINLLMEISSLLVSANRAVRSLSGGSASNRVTLSIKRLLDVTAVVQ